MTGTNLTRTAISAVVVVKLLAVIASVTEAVATRAATLECTKCPALVLGLTHSDKNGNNSKTIQFYVVYVLLTHTYMHTYIHTFIHTYIHACIQTCIHTYMRTAIHTYIHACMHAYASIYLSIYI